MKKIGNVVLLLLQLSSFSRCENDHGNDQLLQSNSELTVEQAKTFVESQRIKGFTLKSGDLQKQTLSVKPRWDKSKTSSNEHLSVVETEIQAMGGFGFVTSGSMEAWRSTGNNAYLYSMSRLVVIKEKQTGEMYSFIMSVVADSDYAGKKGFRFWENTYLKRDSNLSGYVLFHNLSGEFVNGWTYCDGKITEKIIAVETPDLTLRLKSVAEMAIYEWVEICTDYFTVGLVDGEIVSVKYSHTSCSGTYIYSGSYGSGAYTGGSDGSEGGDYFPAEPQPCNCFNICAICGKCLDMQLKSLPIPEDGTAPTTTTDPCEYCSGHPLPTPTPEEVFFDNVNKIKMDSPTLLQEISCLIRNLANSGTRVLTTDVIEGIGDTYNPGYEITQKYFNYQGHNVTIVVVYDNINTMNAIGKRTESQGAQVVFHEIYVRAKMNSARELPNLIRIKFAPNDMEFLNSVWSHIKGTTNLWPCNY